MARTIAEIQDQIIASIVADGDLSGANSPSKRALWRLWTYIVAVAISVFEQILDMAKTDLEAVVKAAPSATGLWIQNRMFAFQYDATNPQYVQVVNLVPQYTTVNEDLRIITRCSVIKDLYNTVNIKLAKNSPPEALDNLEIAAAQDYINAIGIAGINYVVISLPADRLYISADIYCQGTFISSVSENMAKAIDAYLAAIPFDGVLKIVDLIDTMKSITGVNDVILKNVGARKESQDFTTEETWLIQSQTLRRSQWQMQAGYMIGEDETGNTFADTLNFIPQ